LVVAAMRPARTAWHRALDNLGLRQCRAQDIIGGQLAATDRGEHLVERFLREPAEPLADLLVRVLLADTLERRFQEPPTEAGILLAQGIAGRPPDRRARLPRHRDALPRRRRPLALGAKNLYLVAVAQLRRKRHLPAVDDRTDAGVADVGMHRI